LHGEKYLSFFFCLKTLCNVNMARPQCDTLFVPFRKYLLGFFFLCMCRPVLGLGFGAHWMSRLSCCVSTLDCKKTWCVTPVLSLSLSLSLRNIGLAAARWNLLQYHVVGDSSRRHDDVSRPPAAATLVLSSPSIAIIMCLLLRC
jgi:hypothetical protein